MRLVDANFVYVKNKLRQAEVALHNDIPRTKDSGRSPEPAEAQGIMPVFGVTADVTSHTAQWAEPRPSDRLLCLQLQSQLKLCQVSVLANKHRRQHCLFNLRLLAWHDRRVQATNKQAQHPPFASQARSQRDQDLLLRNGRAHVQPTDLHHKDLALNHQRIVFKRWTLTHCVVHITWVRPFMHSFLEGIMVATSHLGPRPPNEKSQLMTSNP